MTSTRTMSVLPGRQFQQTGVIYAILQLGLKTSEPAVLRMCACIVLCYCWYNRADTGMLVLRRDVTIDDFGITINQQGKTIARNQACPVHRRPDARFDRQQEVLNSSVDGINTQLTTRHPQIITGLYKVRTNRRNVGLPPSSPSGSTAYCPLSSVHRLPVRSGQGTLCALEAPVQASLSALVSFTSSNMVSGRASRRCSATSLSSPWPRVRLTSSLDGCCLPLHLRPDPCCLLLAITYSSHVLHTICCAYYI